MDVMMLFIFFLKKNYLCQVWWCMLLVPTHRSQRLECLCEFKASLANIEFSSSLSCPERLGPKQRHEKRVRQWTLEKDTRCSFSASACAQGHANTCTNVQTYASITRTLVQDDPQWKGNVACHIRTPLWVDRTTQPSPAGLEQRERAGHGSRQSMRSAVKRIDWAKTKPQELDNQIRDRHEFWHAAWVTRAWFI